MPPAANFRRDPAHQASGPRGFKPTPKPIVPKVVVAESSPWKRIALLTLLLSSVMIFSASRLGPLWSRMLQDQFAASEMAELDALEPHLLSAKFDEWLARDEQGLQWIVGALMSNRPGVSYAAEQALLRESDTWRIRPNAEAAKRILQIARALSLVADQLPAARRPGVRRQVERFVAWPVEDAVAARELIAACDAIIAGLPPASAEELLLAERDEAEDRRVARSLEIVTPPLGQPLKPELDRDPRELLPPADLPPAESEEPKAAPGKKVPKRFFAPRAQQLPPIASGSPSGSESVLPPAQSIPKKNVSEWIRELADLEVMRLLHHGDYGVRYTAERELDRRGYAKEHLPLAKQLVDPDSRERRKLAEQLPRLTNVDPRPWLLQLTEDEDAEVRRTAEGILQAARPGRESR